MTPAGLMLHACSGSGHVIGRGRLCSSAEALTGVPGTMVWHDPDILSDEKRRMGIQTKQTKHKIQMKMKLKMQIQTKLKLKMKT